MRNTPFIGLASIKRKPSAYAPAKAYGIMVLLRILLLVFFSGACTSLWAQLKEDQQYKLRQNVQVFLEATDSDFESNTIPNLWYDQSAVILAQKTTLFYDQKTSFRLFGKNERSMIMLERERRKIKLLDNSAVADFSELYFDGSDVENGFDGKLIKADGHVEKLDLSRAVAVDNIDNVPNIFRSYTQSGTKRFYKIPVNGLQPGDILDYAYMVHNDALLRDDYMEFAPVYYPCHRKYSTVKQRFEIRLDKNSFLCSKSTNGAPQFTEQEEGEDNLYIWEDRNREMLQDQSFVNEYLLLPMLKFQIVFSSKENASHLFIGNRGELKASFTTEELAKKLNVMFATNNSSDNNKLLSQVKYHLKKMGAYSLKEDDFIKACYYSIRHVCLINNSTIGSGSHAYIFKKLMDDASVPCTVMVTALNNITSLEHVIFRSELAWFVSVKMQFVFSSNANSNVYDMPMYVEGNMAYRLVPGKAATLDTATLPNTAPQDNSLTYTIEASLNTTTDNLTINSTRAYKGNSREQHINTALMYENIVATDWKTYGGYDELSELPEVRREALNVQLLKYKMEVQQIKPLFMQKVLQQEYPDVIAYNKFTLLQDGRSFKKPELKYSEVFELGDYVRHAGKSMLVSIPGLAANQLHFKGNERVRMYDIDLRFARQTKWVILFTIPPGYTAFGMEDLQNSIENETGSFISSATLENGNLIINAVKTYKQPRITKNQWSDMLQWMDAAYNFSQKKILLRKL